MATRWMMACGVAAAVTTAGVWGQSKPASGSPAPVIVLETARGVVEVELFSTDAPKSVAHILELVRKDFYRGHRFHWVSQSVVQTGDPQSRNMTLKAKWGKGGSGRAIGLSEVSKRPFVRGMVGLAFIDDPKTADSQFFITKTTSPNLDGKYTMIGRVTVGMGVVDKIEGDDLLKIAYVKGEKPK